MKRKIAEIKLLIENLKRNYIGEHTARCAYFTLLSFIPLLILILSMTKYIGIEENKLFFIIDNIVSENILNSAVLGIVKEVYSKSLATVTVSAVFTLWSAGKGFFALCKGLNAAYDLEDTNKYIYFRVKAIIATIIFIMSVVVSLVLLVFGNQINVLLQEKFNIFSNIINFILKSKILISVLILSIVFSILYRFIPKHHYEFKNQIPGAIFAAVACNVISIFYSIYVNIFTGFSLMYGSLTMVVLAMMWLYACMYSILLGAAINKMLCEKMSKKGEEKIKKT